ncbi:hypothetical protein LOK49_LG03G02000 [Camellia lanceoleosa]|uniref:Uncharacterized protein n=1 Tax=Camellia lanceoleosa TaxID=1840588 RepID=A0ACC0I962_9ERIC|nr:hypothetical protein LOK49_LG03G02000 [Camellia lanceoleosa]
MMPLQSIVNANSYGLIGIENQYIDTNQEEQKILVVKDAVKKIIIRTLKLLFWGIVWQGGYSHALDDLSYGVDKKQIPWSLIETFTTKLRLGAVIVFLIYMITTYVLYVANWRFVVPQDQGTVKCGMGGHLGLACNVVGYVYQKVSGINISTCNPLDSLKACTFSSPNTGPLRANVPNWCRTPFEPEGLLSLISAIMSGIIGIHYGHILIHFKISYNLLGHSEWLKQGVSMGLGLLFVGIILHFTNDQLYNFKYVCFTPSVAELYSLYCTCRPLGSRVVTMVTTTLSMGSSISQEKVTTLTWLTLFTGESNEVFGYGGSFFL